jgi:hypothetical protein
MEIKKGKETKMAGQKKERLIIIERQPQPVSSFVQTEFYWNKTINRKGR